MTIHSEHPFEPPAADRDPVRRLRGRLGGVVSLWTVGREETDRAGLTVSSFLIAAGDPAHALALLDPDSDVVESLRRTRTAVVQALQWRHRQLADIFAGQFPAPGGAFRAAIWRPTPWGPVLADVSCWAGVRLVDEPTSVGWSVLVDCLVEHIDVGGDDDDALGHRRGRYLRVADS